MNNSADRVITDTAVCFVTVNNSGNKVIKSTSESFAAGNRNVSRSDTQESVSKKSITVPLVYTFLDLACV